MYAREFSVEDVQEKTLDILELSLHVVVNWPSGFQRLDSSLPEEHQVLLTMELHMNAVKA